MLLWMMSSRMFSSCDGSGFFVKFFALVGLDCRKILFILGIGCLFLILSTFFPSRSPILEGGFVMLQSGGDLELRNQLSLNSPKPNRTELLIRFSGVAHADKRANSCSCKNALIIMLKHIREQVTNGVEELSALMTMLPLHSAIVSSCLKSGLLIESRSLGIVPQEEVLFQFEPSEDGEVQFHPSAPIVVEKSPSVVSINVCFFDPFDFTCHICGN
ncbi:GDP-L-galactose phosphorylase 2 [Tanacetum coccineum]